MKNEKLSSILIKKFFLKFWPVIFIFLAWLIFSWPFFSKGLIPFPSTHLVTAFPPWQYYYGMPVKNNAMPDVVTQMYPWKHLVIELIKNRQWPLWNPYNFSGSPLLANFQSAIFHPLNWLFFILPQIDAWSFLILLQPLLAGLFTYLFCREIKASKAASMISAIALMFSGFIVVWMAYGTLAYAVLWLPLALLAIEKSFQKFSFPQLSLLSLSLAFSFFSGHFQTSLYVILAVSLYLLFKVFTTKNFKRFLLVTCFLLLGIFLASPQLLPSLELHQQSVRSQSFIKSEVIPWSYLVTLLAPDFFGNAVTRNDWFGHYAEWAGFIGVIPLVLAIYGALRKRNYYVWFFTLLAIFSLSLALPTPLLDLLIKLKIPVLSTSAVSRIISIFSFSAAILAGFGFDQLEKDWQGKKVFKKVFVFLSIFAFLFLGIWFLLLFFHPLPVDKLLVAKRNFILPTGIFIAFSGITVLGFCFKKKWRVLLILVLFFLISFDLLRFAKKWMPFDPKEYVYPFVPVLEFLTKKVEPDRLFGYFGMEMQNYYQIQGFQGYDPLYIQRYGELLMTASDGKIKLPSTRGVDLERRGKYTMPLLNLLGGKYILHALPDDHYSWVFPFWDYPEQFALIYKDEKYEVYENKHAFPRAFFVSSYEIVEDKQGIIDRLLISSFDPGKTLILEESLPQKIDGQATGRVEILSYTPNKVTVQTRTSSDGLLFLSDNFYPDWKAKIDGKDSKIYRADYSFRAVLVPVGSHRVEFIYEPSSFKRGLWLGGGTLLFLIIGNLFLFLRRNIRRNK